MSQESAHGVTFEPIGYVRNEKQLKFETPHQPNADTEETNLIVLNEGHQFEMALEDLDGFERIWLIFWFDRNKDWRPRVLPPRGPAKRRGVFSTRAPHRPNPIGLTSVRLLGIEGLTLRVGPLDLIDGTPILDIKPYIATIDAYPDSSLGWVGEVNATLASSPQFQIEVSDLARKQLGYLLEQWGIDFTDRAFSILRQDPNPHRTRRILQIEENYYRLACGPWRLYYHIHGQTVLVESIAKGFPDDSLFGEGSEKIPDRDAQVAFSHTFS